MASGHITQDELPAFGLAPVWSQKYEIQLFDNFAYDEDEYLDRYDRSTRNHIILEALISGINHNTLFIPYLTPAQKAVITLLCVSGLSMTQTAQTLNISKSAVSQHMVNIRKHTENFEWDF